MKKFWLVVFTVFLIGITVTGYFLFFDKTEKPQKEKLIMAFGDSLTYGKGDKTGKGYIDNLETKLNRTHRDQTFKIKNYGLVGQESSGVLEQFANLKITEQLNEADCFIVFIGINDLKNSNGGDFQPLHHDQIKQGQQEYLNNLDKILTTLQTMNDKAPILLIGLYNPYPHGERVEHYIEDWNRSTKNLVKNNERVTYISTNDLFAGKDKTAYFSDSLHLNDRGYELIADKILKKYNFNKL